MKPKLVQLVRLLKNTYGPITSNTLADDLNISPRSVKSYIQEINTINPGTILSSRKGYQVDLEKASDLLSSSESTIPQTSDERVSYIINRVIKSGSVNAFDLSDEMYVSYSTLKSELVKVRRVLARNDLQLVAQNDILIVVGLEKNKRKLLSTILYSESKNNFVDYGRMSEIFQDIDVPYIRTTILDTFETYHYFINDYSLENLILHITITIDRIRNGYDSSEESMSDTSIIRSHEHALAEAIIRKLEKHFEITFSDSETAEFTMLIISRASNLDYQTVTQDNLKIYIGEETYQLALDIIKDFNSYFYIDLSAPEFFVRFALHIKNVLIRAHSNYFSKNPLTESIKQNCPLIYDCAVNAARLIHERTGIYLNDDEIAYIAFHIGGALEMQSSIQDKISVCIYCPNYYNLNSKLSERISSIFKDRLIVSSIATSIASLQKSSSDLIISTLPGDLGLSTPAVTISPFLTSQEQSAIGHTIDDLTRQKKQSLFRDNLRLLIHDELFEVRDSFDSKEQVIHYLADKLKQLGYVGDTFEEEVLERDGLSSTAFGSFAIPHAMKMHEKKTAVNILLLRNPMSWDDRPVQLIMMLCFNRDDRYIFNEIFEPITMVLTSKDNLRKLLTVSSSAEFIDLMSSMME